LLEAGRDLGDTQVYQVPAFSCTASEDPAMSWDYFVRHYGDDSRQRRDSKYVGERGGVWYPRAGTLGGCTAHNAMITVYPHNSDWDEIASLTGDHSWNAEKMRSYFQRLERCDYATPPLDPKQDARKHGFAGWLTTSKADPGAAALDIELIQIVLAAALRV